MRQRRTDLTGVSRDSTSCTLDATLCNCNSTLDRRGPTYLPVSLTERLAELTLPQSARTAPARHETRCMSVVTARAPRPIAGSAAITPHAGRPTRPPRVCHVVSAVRHGRSWTIHGQTAAAYSAPPFEHESPLDDHDPRAAIHFRLAQPYGLSPFAHAWYDDSHTTGGRVHAVRAEAPPAVLPLSATRSFLSTILTPCGRNRDTCKPRPVPQQGARGYAQIIIFAGRCL